MPIKKITEFRRLLKGDSILLSAAPDGSHDAIPEMSTHYNEKTPGDEVRPHFHNRVEVYVFVSGKALAMTGEDVALVSTGDVAIAPIGVSHAIKVIGCEPLAYFASTHPLPPCTRCSTLRRKLSRHGSQPKRSISEK